MENRRAQIGGSRMRLLQNQIDTDYQRLEKLRNRRSEIIQKLEQLRDSSALNKTSRDEKNKAIAEKKLLRDQLHKEKAEISDKIKDLIAKRNSLLSSVDYNEDDLLSQLREISWKYQTTTLTLEEDRRAVQKIADLEKRLVFFKKVKDVDKEIYACREKFDELKFNANNLHREIVSLAEESKKNHEILMKCYEERDTLAVELERIKKDINILRDTIGKSKDELFAANAQFKAAQNFAMQQRAEVLAEQAKLIITKRTELAEKAGEKLKNKERMTFEEFAAMIETNGIPT